MGFYERVSNSINRLQGLPEKKRKIIFFTIITISALIITSLFIISAKNHISKVIELAKPINLPEFKTDEFNTSTNDTNINISDNVSNSDSSQILRK